MNYSNQLYDSVSTVQLRPFGEDQWNRIITYSPIYVHWTDVVMMNYKRSHKSTPGKRKLIGPIDMNTVKLEDKVLLNELHDIRKTAAMPSLTTLKDKNSFYESKYLDDEQDGRTTSPTSEYQRSSDFFFQTRESPKLHCSFADTSSSNRQSSGRQPQVNSIGPIKVLPNISLGPKPPASLNIQLRQSAIAREHALTTATDRRSTSPLSMSSSKRPAGGGDSSTRSNYRTPQQYRVLNSQTASTEKKITGGFYEQLSADSSFTTKKSSVRSTNTSRSTMHMLKTKNERARQKQKIELKTVLVKPCRQPISGDAGLEESIPNSIEIMRKLGGSISAFEKNLRYNYHRQLKQYRNGSIKY